MKFIKHLLFIGALLFNVPIFADDTYTVDIGSEYDTTNSAAISAKISAAFGASKTQAFSFENVMGQKTMRTNLTYGFSAYDKHLFKLTDDFLYQKLEFDFGADFGKHEEGVYQNAIGAAYRYDVGGSFLKNFELSSYFSYAPSKNSTFKPEPFTYVPTDEEGTYRVVTFHGRLAGSTLYHQNVSIGVSPWQDGLLTFGADYERYEFDNKWTKKISDTSLGGHVGFSQILFPRLKVESSHRLLRKNQLHSGKLSVLLPSPKDVQFELIGDLSYENNTALSRDYKNVGLTLRSDLWVEPATSYRGLYDKQSLRDWVSEPVVRMHDVMILPEMQYTKDATIYTYLNAPDNSFLRDVGDVKDDYHYQGTWWHVLYREKDFDVGTATFKQAYYYVLSGIINAEYKDADERHMRIRYAGYRKVEGTLGDNWNEGATKSAPHLCQEKSAASCKFKVIL